MDLHDRSILLTGAGSGIGRARSRCSSRTTRPG